MEPDPHRSRESVTHLCSARVITTHRLLIQTFRVLVNRASRASERTLFALITQHNLLDNGAHDPCPLSMTTRPFMHLRAWMPVCTLSRCIEPCQTGTAPETETSILSLAMSGSTGVGMLTCNTRSEQQQLAGSNLEEFV